MRDYFHRTENLNELERWSVVVIKAERLIR